MHSDLLEIGWTEDHWNRLYSAITEEAQKARVGAQVLNVVGPLDPTIVAVPSYALNSAQNNPVRGPAWADARLTVNSAPDLFLTKIAVNVYLHSREAADPDLNGALTMFRRAANYIARIEDALIFNGRPGPGAAPPLGIAGIPPVYRITGDGVVDGLFQFANPGDRSFFRVAAVPGLGLAPPVLGDQVITSIIQSIDVLDGAGQLGPYACILSPTLFEAICTPNKNLVLPRDRILPFLQGPLLRSSAIQNPFGVVIALSASPIELVVARDICLKFLQTTEQSRLAFQVSERVALRIKETAAISILV
jgi:uncharacterized linocin/CFP29 family protein